MALVAPPPRTDRPSVLRLAREMRGMTVRDLAEQLGVSPSHVSKVELQRELAWPRFRRDASRILGIPETTLFPD